MATAIEIGAREQMPTLPRTGYSGSVIKWRVVQAMKHQLDAERRCCAALDALNERICQTESYPPPPPSSHASASSFRQQLDSAH